jgi:hypothetical protein
MISGFRVSDVADNSAACIPTPEQILVRPLINCTVFCVFEERCFRATKKRDKKLGRKRAEF